MESQPRPIAREKEGIMNRSSCLAVFAGILGFAVSAGIASDKWETDFKEASETAKASNRYMLLDFTGSDWCGWCMKLDEEVFGKKEFRKYADSDLVLVQLDFPRGRKLKASLKEQNEELAKKFGVRGYPTIIVLAPDGSLVGKTGYQDGGAEKYITHLKGFIDPHRAKNKIPEPVDVSASSQRTIARPPAVRASKTIASDPNREMRTWTAAGGATLTAALVEERNGNVTLKKEDGSQVGISESQLGAADRKYLADLREAAQQAVAAPAVRQ
jgi:thioredoxin-related protein